MMFSTEQDSVFEVGVSTVLPLDYMMCLTKRRRAITTWPTAASIPEDKRLSLSRRE